MSVTPIAERESNSLAIESDPIKLVSRDSESLSTSNISKLNNKKSEGYPKIRDAHSKLRILYCSIFT